MRFAFYATFALAFGASPVLAQEEGNATGARQSPGFPTIYKSRSVEIVSFGYIRAGLGGSSGFDSPQRCVQLPAAPVKYRLGNECEIYIEPGVEIAFGDLDGTHVDLQMRAAFSGTAPNDYDDWESYIVEAWGALDDFATDGRFAGARIWAGQRFYYRQDTHIHDFYYFDGTGMGVGIEEVPFGAGELAFAIFEHSTYDAESALSDGSPYRRFEARIEEWEAGPATFRASLDLRFAKDRTEVDAKRGALLSGEVDIEGVGQGTLTLTGQLGWGAGRGLQYVSDETASQGAVGARAIATHLTNRNARFAMQTTGLLELQSRDRDWVSFGARPIWRLGESDFHVALEPAIDMTFDGGETARLARVTAAVMWKPGGPDFFDRPSFRAYVSRSDWNDSAEDEDLALSRSGTEGTTIGLQVEHFY